MLLNQHNLDDELQNITDCWDTRFGSTIYKHFKNKTLAQLKCTGFICIICKNKYIFVVLLIDQLNAQILI